MAGASEPINHYGDHGYDGSGYAATNIERLTVELIFRRLSNAEVLAEVRKVFPGRATMSTVAWYRTHLIHDKSLRFERLPAAEYHHALIR